MPASDGDKHHIQGDALDAADAMDWDLMIAHPPCTYLSVSGMHWTKRGLRDPQLTEDAILFVERLAAAGMHREIPRIAIENPVSVLSTRWRKPDQIIQPWMFGHDASKTTCLWLKNLPPLKHTKIVAPHGWKLVKFAADLLDDENDEAWCDECQADFAECECYGPTQDGIEYQERAGYLFGKPEGEGPTKLIWSNQTPSGQNKLGPSADRWAKRSETFGGLAQAMADQWGSICP